MDRRVRTEYERMKKMCKEWIGMEGEIPATCIILQKDKGTIADIRFQNNTQKEIVRQKLMQRLAETEDLLGYMLIFDVFVSEENKKTKEMKKVDALVVSAYTAKDKEVCVIKYKGKELDKEEMKTRGRNKGEWDNWDLWGQCPEEELKNEEIRKALEGGS